MPPDDRTRAITPQAADSFTAEDGPTTVVRGPAAVPPPVADAAPTLTFVSPAGPADTTNFAPTAPAQASDLGIIPFAQFEPVGELGRGGMGVVYRVLDTHFMRDVAVKVLSERLAGNPTATRRFLEEARVTAQLGHNTIPPVHQIGTLSDGRPYLVMKLIQGETLADELKARPDPSADLTRFLDILEKVCEGVGYAHSRRVIHRDLKPANIMVGAFGDVQVMDWGLAKELSSGDPTGAGVAGGTRDPDGSPLDHTQAGTILGTPPYMSPEQATGDTACIDTRADVFSLGAVLCVVLTGHPPYSGTSVHQVVLKAANWETADAFRRLGMCTADPELVALCRRCLARQPDERPADGAAVAAELARLRASAAERLRRADLKRMAEIAKRVELKKRVWLGAGAAVVIAGLIGGGVVYGVWNAWEQEKRDSAARREKADAELREAEADRERDRKVAAAQKAKEEGEQKAKDRQRDLEVQVESALREMDAALAEVARPEAAGGDDRWAVEVRRARAAQERAEKLLAAVGGSPLGGRVTASAERVGRAEKDLALVQELDEVAFAFLDQEWTSTRPDTADRYRKAFDAAGLSVDRPDTFAERVKTHPRPAALTEAVFDWYSHTEGADQRPLTRILDAVTAGSPFLAEWWAETNDLSEEGTARLVALASGAKADRQSGWVYHRMFRELWHRGEYEAAKRVMRRGLGRHPDDYRLAMRFTIHLATEGTPAARREGVECGKIALAVRPRSVTACLLLARLLADDRPADAIEYLTRADENTTAAEPRWQRAAVYRKLGEKEKAEKDEAEAIRRDPTGSARLRLILGRWYKWQRAEAAAELTAVIPTVPKTAAAQLALAQTCHSMHRYGPAADAYRASLEADPNSPSVRVQFALLMFDQAAADPSAFRRCHEEAEAVLARGAQLAPNDAALHMNLVAVYVALKDGPKALAAARKVGELDGDSPNALNLLGYAQMTAGRYADADASAAALARKEPKSYRGPNLRASIAAAQGKWADAAKHQEEAVRLAPIHGDLWNQLAIYRGYGLDRKGAVAALEKALAREPNNALYHWNISGWYFSLLDVSKGVKHQALAWELNDALKGRKAEAPKPPSR
jgi:tetratricopeptide (TPR) repeat protein